MKKANKLLALAFVAVAMVFASCSKDNKEPVGPTQQEIEAKIVGKWKNIYSDGLPLLTNNRTVLTYCSDRTGTISVSRFIEDLGIYIWDNKASSTWNVEGKIICNKRASFDAVQFHEAIEIDDNSFSYILTKIFDPQQGEQIMNWNFVAQKVTSDYSKDIIGMWEGVEMTGYETYGDYHHCIEYRADGTYTYYNWDESTNQWHPLADVIDEWNVDGDWLATRWQNNGSEVMNYEWWDIDYIKKEGDDIIMKWSALREKENGERFTTTFTWRKVK